MHSLCVSVCVYLQCLESHLKCKTDNEAPFWANLHIQLLYLKQRIVMTLILFSTLDQH